jgi:hypothetical protein
MSTGAKAGVGVGVGVVGAALVAGFIWFLIRKRKPTSGARAELEKKPPTQWGDNISPQSETQHPPVYPTMQPMAQHMTQPGVQPGAQPEGQTIDHYSNDHYRHSKITELDGGITPVLHEMESPQKTPESLGGSTVPRSSAKQLYEWKPAS